MMERLSIFDIAAQMIATARKRPIAQMVALCTGAGVLLDHARRNSVSEEKPARKRVQPKKRKARKTRKARATQPRAAKAAAVPAAPATVAAPVVAPAKPETPRGGAPFHVHGVTLHAATDDERISFRGKETDLTARQAQLAALLMRGHPNPVDRKHLIEKLGIGGSFADTQLGAQVGEVRRAVASIGLDVKTFKGIGVALAIPEAGE